MSFFNRWRRLSSQSYNWQTLRSSPLSELSGSLGDLGTLLPLMIALAVTGCIDLSSTLVFTGLANILTGLTFGLPLPVQPMKAIAAVAIASQFSREKTASAGLFVGGVIAVLSVTGLLNWIGRVVPIPVVKGIQVGAGLTLVLSAGSTLLQPLRSTEPVEDNLLWAIAAFLFLLYTTAPAAVSPRGLPLIPFALIIFIIGLVLSFVSIYAFKRDYRSNPTFFGLWFPHPLLPSPYDFQTGAFDAGLGQIPLTALNSIIAVTHLSAELLPSRPVPSPTAIGLSIAVFNLVGTWFGAMPLCHGSGGLAAQHRFGARSGASVIFLGLVKLVLGLVVSEEWLMRVLGYFPKSLLGVMVVAAGVELARVGEGLNVGGGSRDLWEEAERAADASTSRRRWCPGKDSFAVFESDTSSDALRDTKHPREPDEKERQQRWLVMMITVAGILAFKNDAVGFIAGLLCHWSMQLPQRWWRRREDAEESESLLNESTG